MWAECLRLTLSEVIDGTGCTLLPGLIDSHTHLVGGALKQAWRLA